MTRLGSWISRRAVRCWRSPWTSSSTPWCSISSIPRQRDAARERPRERDPRKLSQFLLELGKGFAFVARQKHLSFEDKHFYVDLVFYNVILKCYLLIDLKLGKLAHQDVGQMDSSSASLTRRTTAGDGPTIGLVLCAEKNEAVARYSVLHENKQLFAAKCVTYLPSVEELQRELARERRLLEVNDGDATVAAKKRGPSPRRGPRAQTRRPKE